ncbi:unnamed protein product [Clavelina lepadiformis]|uniref:Uncharacterized protein n=1 Tax=Clavelina lepadiformis TaxID=159417 RepID=A0ABP0FKP4_CLALP
MDQEEEPGDFQSQPIDAAQAKQYRHVEERLQEMDLQDEGSQPVARTEDVGSQQLALAGEEVAQIVREVASSGAAGTIHLTYAPQFVQQTQFQDKRRNMHFENVGGDVHNPGGEVYGNVGQPGEDFRHREIIRRLEKYQYGHYGGDGELLRVYEQIRQISDEQLTKNAAELFPERLHLYSIKLTESQIDSFLFILTKIEKRIDELYLINCFSKPEDVGRLFETIQAMPGKIGFLNISDNIIPKIPSKSFFNKIEIWLDIRNCFPDDDAMNGKRDANQSEIAEIQRILDQLDDSELRVVFGRCDGKWVILSSRKKSDIYV